MMGYLRFEVTTSPVHWLVEHQSVNIQQCDWLLGMVRPRDDSAVNSSFQGVNVLDNVAQADETTSSIFYTTHTALTCRKRASQVI